METDNHTNFGSFRDSAGQIFNKGEKIYRAIFAHGVKDYKAARDAGVHKRLVEAGIFLPHEEVDLCDLAPEGTEYCLNHPKLPMVSYPWEWPFSMLKDAALIHLDAMEILVPDGFWLRDASAFNVQYDGDRLRIIDTLSIGKRVSDSPWVGYSQFCSHFLAPLAMAAYCDIRTLSLWRNYINGYPLSLTAKLLPLNKRYRPGIFMHLVLHSRFQESADKSEDIGKAKLQKRPNVNDRALIGLISSLRRTVNGIKWRSSSQIWKGYHKIRTYQDDDVNRKSEYIDKIVERVQPKMVWDLGGNTGEFSIISASHGAFVVSIDQDPACTEYLYDKLSQENGVRRILPLTMDLANPSPSLGWDNRERPGLSDRGPADLILALALIHHLVLSSYVPLPMIAEWFSRITTHLIVEYIPPDDTMVTKLLMNRGDEHLPYSEGIFLSSFERYFDLIDKNGLPNGRVLFHYKRR